MATGDLSYIKLPNADELTIKDPNAVTSVKDADNTTYTKSSGVVSVPSASTSTRGVTKLSSATDSTSEVLAATPKAVKTAYDLANTANSTANSKYSVPSGGIPKTDLASAVQTSLTAADNAVPKTRTVNSKALSSDITLTAADVGAIATTAKGAASGVAELDANGKVPSSQLPSYVDDVLEYSAKSSFPSTGETGKIYVDTSDNKTYRWSGSAYVEISESLALGETSSTAYYGDKGKTAYNHSQVTSGNPHNVTKSDVGLGNVGNFKAVSTVASQGLSSTEKSNARANIGAGTSSFSGSYNDLSNKPTLGTAAAKDVPSSGNASTSQVVMGNDSRLSDARTPTSHTHTKSQITDFPSSMAPTSHTHGNIQNGGTLQTNDITIASGDKLVVTDASDSNKVARTSASFDGSTTIQALTKKGTFETFPLAAYGTCDTAADVAAKVVTLASDSKFTLVPGSMVAVLATYTNIASNPTLNVNGTGAKPIVYGTAVIETTNLAYATYANRQHLFMYDGTNYIYLTHNVDNNSTYSNASLGQGYGTCTTAAATAAKVVTLSNYALATGGIVSVKFSYDVPASATMNINSKGAKAIYHRGAAIAAGVIKAGDTATFIYSTYYHLISIDRDDNTSAVTGVKGDAEQSFRTGNVSITPANIGAVALTGNTITGDIQRKQTEIDASKANNNISATKYPTTYSIIDNANRILVRNEAIVESSGNISWYAYVRNYNTSGSQVAQKGIKYTVNKSGTGTWTVDDASSFRSAIGAGTYSKGSDGIPKTDLATAVQTSLGLADTALQSHQTIKQDGVTGATVNRFGTCGTAAATAAKTVSITSGTFSLEAGARVTVKFTYANTANTPTLNVNSKGAKNIFHKGSQITSGSNKALLAGTVDFIYDGTQWHLIGNYIDTNTDTHRPIQVNGTERLGNNTTALNLTAGGHVRLRVFDDEPNRVHVHNVSWTGSTRDIHVKLNDLTWTQSGGGMYYSSNVTPDVGDYVIRHFYGATIVDFDNMAPVFILPCVGFSFPIVWFMSSTGTFPSDAELVIRVFYPVNYEDNN